MFSQLEPYSGHYYEAEYLEWDENNNTYKTPIFVLVKGQTNIGVSTGVKEQTQESSGNRWVIRHTFRINVIDDLPVKVKDKFIIDGKDYIALKVSPNVNHPNAMGNLMFDAMALPTVVYLGDK